MFFGEQVSYVQVISAPLPSFCHSVKQKDLHQQALDGLVNQCFGLRFKQNTQGCEIENYPSAVMFSKRHGW